jgi:hypothetical protein
VSFWPFSLVYLDNSYVERDIKYRMSNRKVVMGRTRQRPHPHDVQCIATPPSVSMRSLLDMYVDTLSTLGSLFSLPLTPCVVRVGDRSLTGY